MKDTLLMRPISLFIPCYNSEKTLPAVIQRIPESLWKSIFHVYIIDDGSTDQTIDTIDKLARDNPRIISLRHAVNRGYGVAVKTGIRNCKYDGCAYAVCLHSDGQYPPEYIEAAVEKMKSECIDLLQGSRIASGTALSGGMPFYKYIGGRTLSSIESRIFRLDLTDFHSGFLIYNRRILDADFYRYLSDSFDIDLEIIATARSSGFKIGELPIPTCYAGEKSYLNPLTYFINVLRVLFGYMNGKYGSITNG